MSNLLFLVHRFPYPPNKGDKVRSYHLLKHLSARHQVFLGTFMDDSEDQIHVPVLQAMCTELQVVKLSPLRAKLQSLVSLLTGGALTLRYYRDGALKKWVSQVLLRHRIDAIVVFSSAMGQYVPEAGSADLLIDFVDVDSEKWSEYSQKHVWPLSWLYRREAETLLAFERKLAKRSKQSFFVTEKEGALFASLAPECAGQISTLSNGVDADFFSPDVLSESPFKGGGNNDMVQMDVKPISIVFTGAMDYWPNVDAVTWFAREIFPLLRKMWPQISFYIVGRAPTPGVWALAGEGVKVTGTVPDVRPYLQHADVVVAPLRLARGIQNKILEAMAMARPVVTSSTCATAMDVRIGHDLIAVDSVADYVCAVQRLINMPDLARVMGLAGRSRVVNSFSWQAHLSQIDAFIGEVDSAKVPV